MRFVVWGTYCDDVLEKRTPFRQEHLDGLQKQKEAGLLITLGPTADTRLVFGIYEADSQEQVEATLHADVYWRQGIWTDLQVHAWIQAF
ncbi:MAG: YciI family protein [Cyanobium sp.]